MLGGAEAKRGVLMGGYWRVDIIVGDLDWGGDRYVDMFLYRVGNWVFGLVNIWIRKWIRGCLDPWMFLNLYMLIHKHGISRAETQFTWCFAQKTSGMSHKISIRQCI